MSTLRELSTLEKIAEGEIFQHYGVSEDVRVNVAAARARIRACVHLQLYMEHTEQMEMFYAGSCFRKDIVKI